MEAIIFDCDGTLVDSEDLGSRVMADYLDELGHSVELPEAFALFRGSKMANMVGELESRLATTLPAEFVPELRRRMAEVFRQRLRPIAGARDLLQKLRVPFCVASSGPREKIELSLTITGLRAFFGDRIFSAYDVGSWKPDPGLFLHAAEAMRAVPESCVVVEDSPLGVHAGVAAGMTVFALQTDRTRFDLPEGVRRISSLVELEPLLTAGHH